MSAARLAVLQRCAEWGVSAVAVAFLGARSYLTLLLGGQFWVASQLEHHPPPTPFPPSPSLPPFPPPPLLPCRYFPTILIVLLAVFNDGAMIALSKDNVTPSRLPNRWNLTSIFLAGELLSWRRQAGGAELAALSWQR